MADHQQHSAGATQVAERPAQSASHAKSTGGAGTQARVGNGGGATVAQASTAPREPGRTASAAGGTSATPGATSAAPGAGTKPIPFAAVSFVSGLVGLLVANLILGPLAIVLGAIGLRADKNRRVRATLGILLGVADIAVFLLLAAHSGAHHGSVSWNFFGN